MEYKRKPTKESKQLKSSRKNSGSNGFSLEDNREGVMQLRKISGQLVTGRYKNNVWKIEPKGRSNPPNLNISNGGVRNIGAGVQTRVLKGTDDLMRGHLVKASWDGDNSMERMTQWREGVEEAEWAKVEEEAQKIAVNNSEKISDQKITTAKYNVTTETVDNKFGNKLLGADNSSVSNKKLKEMIANGQGQIIDNLRDELNRMISSAEMTIEGDSKIKKYDMSPKKAGSITSNADNGISIK